MSLGKPNKELKLTPSSILTRTPLSPSSLNFFLRDCYALGFESPRSWAAVHAYCMPRDCHTPLGNKTIFSPLCLKPLVIIYLKHAQILALRHVSGSRKSRVIMCLPDPCPAFA